MIDATELTWFLTEGISVFERSTTGAILDKLSMDAFVSRACRRCNGAGILEDPWSQKDQRRLTPEERGKFSDEYLSKQVELMSGAWCPKCFGTGSEPVRLTPDEQRMVDSGDWSASADHEGQRSAVPDAVLVRYAHVSRTLAMMPMLLREAIVLAYGDEGEELSHTIRGRSWACAPLTVAGASLLAKERQRRTQKVEAEPELPIRCLTALASLGHSKAHPERTKLLAEAVEGAIALLKAAEAEWDHLTGQRGAQ